MERNANGEIRIEVQDTTSPYAQDGSYTPSNSSHVNDWDMLMRSDFLARPLTQLSYDTDTSLESFEHYIGLPGDPSKPLYQQTTPDPNYQSDGYSSTDELSQRLMLNLDFNDTSRASYPGSPGSATSPPALLSPHLLTPSQSGYTSSDVGPNSPTVPQHWLPNDNLSVPLHSHHTRGRSRHRASFGAHHNPYSREQFRRPPSGYFSDAGPSYRSPSSSRARSSSVVSTSSSHNGYASDHYNEFSSLGVPNTALLPHPRDDFFSDSDDPASPLDNRYVSDAEDQPSGPRRQVGSEAIMTASSSRRKKPAKYFCDVPGCKSSFTTVQNFRYHQDSHKGIKNFTCRSCSKSFGTPHVAKRHEHTCPNSRTGRSSRQVSRASSHVDLGALSEAT